jgi:hypothetical protein
MKYLRMLRAAVSFVVTFLIMMTGFQSEIAQAFTSVRTVTAGSVDSLALRIQALRDHISTLRVLPAVEAVFYASAFSAVVEAALLAFTDIGPFMIMSGLSLLTFGILSVAAMMLYLIPDPG